MRHLSNIISESLEERLKDERSKVDTTPTDGQKKAGNYKKGHIWIHGLEITIENPKGSYRRGKGDDGKEWKTLMHNDYGYFTRSVGKDGDAVDVFIGPNLDSEKVFPIDQYYKGKFDETKVMLGFDSAEEAKAAYLSNYSKDWKGFKYITEIGIDKFKKWLYDGHRQRKPFKQYIWVKNMKKRNVYLTEQQFKDYCAYLVNEGVVMMKTWSSADILKLLNNQSQLPGYDYFAIQASKWGRGRMANYADDQTKFSLPAVKYDNGKYYVFINDKGWEVVPFNYDVLNKTYLENY